MNAIYELAANLLILYIALVLGAFIILYFGFYHWRLTAAGRSVMYLIASLELVFLLAAILNWVDVSEDARAFLRYNVFLLIAWATTQVLVVLATRWKRTGEPVPIEVEARVRGARELPVE